METIKTRFPDKKCLADLKIMDAGKIEATSAFQRGADIVTVLGCADDQTVRGALEAAEAHGGLLMADLINVRDPVGRARADAESPVSIAVRDAVPAAGGPRDRAAGLPPMFSHIHNRTAEGTPPNFPTNHSHPT